jgi:protein-tyrosine phosphatase
VIDIHAHILPGVDDGPVSWGESLAMIRQGIEDGIRGVVCTSHVLDRLDEGVEKEFIQKFEELKRKIKKEGMKISLWLGAEIHCHVQFELRSPVATFNGHGKYALIELPLGQIPQDAGDLFFKLSVEGVTPILAHPERNTVILQRPRVAYEYVRRGVLLQINAGSVTGNFGKRVKRVALAMLDHQMVHFVASDCHSPGSRPMVLSKAYKVITHRWGKEIAEKLFRENPYKAVIGEEISSPPPLPMGEGRSRVERFTRFGIFKRR